MNKTELVPPESVKAHKLLNWFPNFDGTLLAFYRRSHSGFVAIAIIGKTGLVETFSVLPSNLNQIY